jgi:hypothetical protein
MDETPNVIVENVVATLRVSGVGMVMDERTLGRIVHAVIAAINEQKGREERFAAATRIADDGRHGLDSSGS